MSNNMKRPYPVILLISNHTKCEFAQLYCLLQDMDNVQNAVNLTLHAEAKSIQSTANLSRHCSQFTPAKVYNTSSIYVTVNMCNQGIRVFPEIFSEYAYSLKWPGNTRIP